MIFKKVKSNDPYVVDTCLTKHYLHRTPSIKYAFVAYEDETENPLGMITFSIPQFPSVLMSICNNKVATHDNTMELSRLYVEQWAREKYNNLASQIVSKAIRWFKPMNKIIYSYSDRGAEDSKLGAIKSDYKHQGYIYQACNFWFCGVAKGSFKAYNGLGKRGGNWVKGRKYRFVIYPNNKNRYIYVAGDKRFKRLVRQNLKHKPEQYPKGDEMEYTIGDMSVGTERFILDRQTGDTYKESDFIHTKLYKEYFIDTDMYS